MDFHVEDRMGMKKSANLPALLLNISVRKCSYIYLGKKADADDFTQPFLYGF